MGGVAARKLGFFAVLGDFLAKFAKVAVIGGIALLAGLRKFLRRNDAEQHISLFWSSLPVNPSPEVKP